MAKKKRNGSHKMAGYRKVMKKTVNAAATVIELGFVSVPVLEGGMDLVSGSKSAKAVGIETIYDLTGYDITKKVWDSRHLGQRAAMGLVMFGAGRGMKWLAKKV